MLNRLLKGNRTQYSRWRDEKGNFVGWDRLVRNGSRACATGFMRVAFGKRPAMPWISYDAAACIREFLRTHVNPRVLEFGSGMSTIWYAKHSAEVCSIDDNEEWFKIVQERLRSAGIKNVEYFYTDDRQEYVRYGKRFDKPFDLIMVDGSDRGDCVEHSLDCLAKGGIIYLDNSDKNPKGTCNEYRKAETLLLEYSNHNACEVTYYTDFAPTQFFAEQGLLLKRSA